jgi:transposase
VGGHPKVNLQAEAELQQAVEAEPRCLGLGFSNWSCQRLAVYLWPKLGQLFSAETIRRHLHKLGWRPLRPVHTVSSPDPDYQAKAAQLGELQQRAQRGELILLYQDEIDLALLPTLTRLWTPKGQQYKVDTPRQNRKCYGFGAINYTTGQVSRQISGHKDSDSFIELLTRLWRSYAAECRQRHIKAVLVMDNYIIHHSAKAKAALAKEAAWLEVFALPTYSPELNLIEQLWRHLRRVVTHNYGFSNLAALGDAVEEFLNDLDEHRQQALTFIGNTNAASTALLMCFYLVQFQGTSFVSMVASSSHL